MLVRKVLAVFSVFLFKTTKAEDVICTINGRKSLNTVDDRFLSLSIDPAALITGININYTSLLLARNLSPSYVRIAGPSTEFLKFMKDGDSISGLAVTASMWQSMNEWFKMANLTPIFAINDAETVNGAWNPKPFYPLMDLSDKLDIACLWQLGFDSSCKTLPQYKEDLITLKHITDTFPTKKTLWKTVGSDVSGYAYNVSTTRHFLHSLRDQVDFFMYENASLENEENFPDMTMKFRLQPKGSLKIWTTAPKSKQSITFASALEWARQIGDAARAGFGVVFRQPRLHEFFVDSPTFWVSVLHKCLMGRKVLDLKVPQEKERNFYAYAHCTKKQNDFSRLGAITIMVVNNETTPNTLALKLGTGNAKKIFIRSYILTTTHEKSVHTFLNGEKLSMEMLEENEKFSFAPKLRRAQVTKFLSLPLPGKSIGFFVLPGARVPVCINEEYNMNLLMQEIHEDQNIKFETESEEDDEKFELPRFENEEASRNEEPLDFNKVFRQIEKELENDEDYYKNFQYETTDAVQVKDFKRETKPSMKPKRLHSLNLEIDTDDMKDFIKSKLKSDASELTSQEIDEEASRIAKKLTSALLRMKPTKYIQQIANPLRDTRDINMDLVRIKADHSRPHLHQRKSSQDTEQHAPLHHPPRISSRRNDEVASSTHRHSSHRHSQSDRRVSPKFQHSTRSRTHNFRHASRSRPTYRLKGKRRDSKEGVQSALGFMGADDDASVSDDYKGGSFTEHEDLFGVAGFQGAEAEDEYGDDLMDFAFPMGHPLDFFGADSTEDYYEFEIYPHSPFLRRKRSASSNSLAEDKYHFVLGKAFDPSKIRINERQKEHQLGLLRKRLNRRKKLVGVKRKLRATTEAPTQTKVFVSGKKPFSRQKRSALEFSLQTRYKKYIPKTKHLKAWKPSDILKLKRGYMRQKRSVDSSENAIENGITDVTKKGEATTTEVPRVVPVLNQMTMAVASSSTTTAKSVETDVESASNCVTNEECLSLILATSLDSEELFKPGWLAKTYGKISDFLVKLQKDVLQLMTE